MLWSAWPEVWPNVNLTQSLIQGGTADQSQPDPKSDQMSTWPEASSRGFIWLKISLTWSLTKCQPDPKPHLWGYIWPEVCLTWSDQMSTWPEASLWEYIWPKVNLTQRSDKYVSLTWSLICREVHPSAEGLSENLNTLCILGLASQRSFAKDQWRTTIWTLIFSKNRINNWYQDKLLPGSNLASSGLRKCWSL